MNAKSLLPLLTALLIAPAAVPLLPTAPIRAQNTTETDATVLLAEADRLIQLGRQHYRDAQYEAAFAVWQQALTLVRTLDQTYQEENILYDLGEAYYNLGEAYDRLEQYPQALAHYQQALDIARVISSQQGEGMCLEKIGDIYVELGQYLQALQTYQHIFHIEYSLTANHTDRHWHGIEDVFANIYREIHSHPDMHTDAIALFDQMIEEMQASQDSVVAGLTWRAIAMDYETQRESDKAIPFYQDAIALFSTLKNWDEAISTIERLGTLYQREQQPAAAIALYQEVLERFEDDLTPELETRILEQLANLYRISGDEVREIESYQRILGLIPEEEERWEHLFLGTTARYRLTMLLNLGQAYGRQGQYDLAQSTFEELLTRSRTAGDRNQELDVLRQIGAIQRQNQQYASALETYQNALAIAQELAPPRSDRPHSIEASISGGWESSPLDLEIATLLDLSTTYSRLGQETSARQAYQDALQLSRQLNGLEGEFVTVYHLAQIYDQQLHQREKAITLYQDALHLARELNDMRAQIYVLLPLGERYSVSGPYSEAINAYQMAINLYENHSSEAVGRVSGAREQDLLTAIALSYQRLGNYADAIRIYQQALDASGSWYTTDEEIVLTHYLGTAYRALGQYDRALELQTQAQTQILQQAYHGNWGWSPLLEEAIIFDGLGITYQALGQYQTALDYHQKALNIFQEASRLDAPVVLNHMGMAYQALGQYDRARELHRQALAAFQGLDHRSGEATALLALGDVYQASGDHQQALSLYQQAFSLQQQLGDRVGEQRTFATLGRLLTVQHQPELAIVFYKQAVNISESIRSDLQTLPQELQQSYTETISETYRELADLLLQQNRILEAQEVLDLLKLQELQDYELQDVRGTADTRLGLDFWEAEQAILDRFFTQLSINPQFDFNAFITSPDIIANVQQLQQNARGQNLNPALLVRLQDNLQQAGNAALLYPLILDDRLELVLVTPDGLINETVPVDRLTLNAAIVSFRQDITDRFSDPRANGQQLYEWLMQPIVDDLDAAGVDTILYAADGALRYIPIAALYDGNQWLTERFTINHITAASLTDFTQQGANDLNILAGAFPEQDVYVNLGTEQVWFSGLPFAQDEVQNLVSLLPQTTAFFSQDFNRSAIETRLNDDYTIIHLATHAEFRSGHPTDSFILLGDGDRLTVADLNRWQLPDVDLVVLSACKTAVSSELGDGAEILGFGYQMQQTGADAAIASLWYVSDGGTQVLMDAFYTALDNGLSESEALRRSQQALITSDESVLAGERGNTATIEIVDQRTGEPLSNSPDLAHPYYWAPFILIGNGL